MKLLIELIPKTAWGKNVRTQFPKTVWDTLRKKQYQEAGFRCEICGASGKLECHEVWEYIEEPERVQKLVRLIALCPDCHAVKHMGRTSTLGEEAFEHAVRHMMEVNGWNVFEARDHIEEAFVIWRQRSQYDWKLDTSSVT